MASITSLARFCQRLQIFTMSIEAPTLQRVQNSLTHLPCCPASHNLCPWHSIARACYPQPFLARVIFPINDVLVAFAYRPVEDVAWVSEYSFCSVAELMILGDVETADINGRNGEVARTVHVAHGAVRCNYC